MSWHGQWRPTLDDVRHGLRIGIDLEHFLADAPQQKLGGHPVIRRIALDESARGE